MKENIMQTHFKIPQLKGGLPWLGHIFKFSKNPFEFLQMVHEKLGNVASFNLLGRNIILLSGAENSSSFYQASDQQLDQAAVYNRLMKPIFGEGVVFDATPQRREEQIKMLVPALKMDAMRSYATKIEEEVETITSTWNENGEVDLLEFMQRLTINTACRCLLGEEFRTQLNHEFTQIYHDLEKGVHPLAYYYPNLPLPVFRRRDKARKRLEELVDEIVKKRQCNTSPPNDMLQRLINASYSDGTSLTSHEITGLLLTIIFAGHHTSAGTAAWCIIELLRNPDELDATLQEIGKISNDIESITFDQIRSLTHLDLVVKEVLRLHPPLILLMRHVKESINIKNFTIPSGETVWTSPAVNHRLSNIYEQSDKFQPQRFSDRNQLQTKAWQPFGGGKHKCSGASFATFQIKVILTKLLQNYDFELIHPASSYLDDYREMIVQPKLPCKLRYRRKKLHNKNSKENREPKASASFDHLHSFEGFHEAASQGKCPFSNL